MNKEEIKRQFTMRDILERYGLRPNRAGFIRCPFHKGDRTASMKIYKDSFHCFGCGEGGDIFKFIQKMDGVSFKDAYISLGGEYASMQDSREDWERLLAEQKKRAEESKHRIEQRNSLHFRLIELNGYISLLMRGNREFEPFSDAWCMCVNELELALYKYERLRKEVMAI